MHMRTILSDSVPVGTCCNCARSCMQVASILHSLDAEGTAESEAVLEEAFATIEGVVEPVEEDEAEARLLQAHCVAGTGRQQSGATSHGMHAQCPSAEHALAQQRRMWGCWSQVVHQVALWQYPHCAVLILILTGMLLPVQGRALM